MLPRVLATVEDGRARRTMARIVPRLVGGPGAGRIVARMLRTLVEGGRHQEMLGFLLAEMRRLLDSRQETLEGFIQDKVRAQGGRLVGWALGAQVANRVMTVLREELDRMGPDGSTIRDAFDEWVRREIDRMETDPERAAEIGRAVRRVVAHETVQAWLWDVWSRMRLGPGGRCAPPRRPHPVGDRGIAGQPGRLPGERRRGAGTPARGGGGRGGNPAARAPSRSWPTSSATWWRAGTRTCLTDKLELRVGRDLQYVRVNGTLVGFLVGGALFLALRAVFGGVAG